MFKWIKNLFKKKVSVRPATIEELITWSLEAFGILDARVKVTPDPKNFDYSFIKVFWSSIFAITKVNTTLCNSDYMFRCAVAKHIAQALLLKTKGKI